MARLLHEILGSALFVPGSLEGENIDGSHSIDTVSAGSLICDNNEIKSKSPSVSSTSSNEETGTDPTLALCSSTLSIETNSSGGSKHRSRGSKNSNKELQVPSSPTINSDMQNLWGSLTPAQLMNKIIISVSVNVYF